MDINRKCAAESESQFSLSRAGLHTVERENSKLPSVNRKLQAMNANHAFASCQVARVPRSILRTLAFIIAGAPSLLLAQYSEMKMGEYLHYAVVAANGGIYAGI